MQKKVFSYLTLSDLKHLRLVCKHFYILTLNMVYESSKLNIMNIDYFHHPFFIYLIENIPIVNVSVTYRPTYHQMINAEYEKALVQLCNSIKTLKNIEIHYITNGMLEAFKANIHKLEKIVWTNLINEESYNFWNVLSEDVFSFTGNLENESTVKELVIEAARYEDHTRDFIRNELFTSRSFNNFCTLISKSLQSLTFLSLPFNYFIFMSWLSSRQFEKLEILKITVQPHYQSMCILIYILGNHISGDLMNQYHPSRTISSLLFDNAIFLDDVIPVANVIPLDFSRMCKLQVNIFYLLLYIFK